MSGPRYRFAPSPTGFFHVGGARTALFNWALARQQGGTFVLRIEDTDEARNRPEWTQGIIDSLAWIGISPDDPHFEGPLYQSHYVDEHVAAAQRLFESGHAYYCEMTPDEIQERAKAEGTTGYGGWSRDLGLGPGSGRVLRFRVPAGSTMVHDLVRGEVSFDNATIEDFVLLRGNGTPVFILANVVDDLSMRISHVVRAEEHLPNTPKQQMIWEALGEQPPVWAHVPVLVNEQRKKLSKRRDKVALEQYREEGYLADAMVNYLMTLGWSPGETEIQPWSAMEPVFRLEDVNKSPAFFDLKKLAAFNGEYIRMLSVDELVAACEPWLPAEWDRARFAEIALHIQQRLVTLADAPGVVDFLFAAEPVIDQESWDKTFAPDWAVPLLADTAGAFDSLGDWNADALKATLEDVMNRYELKLGKAQAPVRVAVTGRTVGPPLFEALEVMGRDETLRRLRAALERAAALMAVETDVAAVDPGTSARDRSHRAGRRVLRGMVAVAALLAVYYLVTLFQVWRAGKEEGPTSAEVIVVLGAAQYDGTPSPQLAARLDHALDLWEQGVAPFLMVTGGKLPADRFTEAEASRSYLIERGVPDAVILQEDIGRDTYESLDAAADVLAAEGLDEVVLVTDPYHSLRSRLIAEEVGLDASLSPTPTSVVTGWTSFRREVFEAGGVAVGRVLGFDRLSDITG